MRKTCICGNEMMDTIVPNNTVYWTYMKSDENALIEKFRGDSKRINQSAIWVCSCCKRFYYWSKDWNLYTYKRTDCLNIDIKTINWDGVDNIYYSFNDYQRAEMRDELIRTGEIKFPIQAYLDNDTKDVIVKYNDKISIYHIEKIEAMSRD